MMSARRSISAAPPPLLVWRETGEIARIEDELTELQQRMARLKPHSHARLELQYRAKLLRARQLKIETAMRAGK